jgi:hypothetical protein
VSRNTNHILLVDDLFEINRYLERSIKFRLAFREFGTCMGLQCESEQTGEKERAVDFKSWSDAIIAAWDPYMELSAPAHLTPADLRPITRVMYASALIPGGKWPQKLILHCSELEVMACFALDLRTDISAPSLLFGLSRP